MSDTIWVRRKSEAAKGESVDDFDHSLFCKYADALDAHAQTLGVRKLSEFFDTTDLQFNFSDDELPETWIADNEQWFDAARALPALRSVIASLKAGPVKGVPAKALPDLLEEPEDCEAKVAAVDADGDRFHFCVVG